MAFCESCGAQIQDGIQTCPVCGRATSAMYSAPADPQQYGAPQQPQQQYPPAGSQYYGAPQQPQQQYPPAGSQYYGAPQQPQQQYPPTGSQSYEAPLYPPAPPKQKEKNKMLMPIIACIAVIVVAFLALLLFTDIFKGNKNDDQGSSISSSRRDQDDDEDDNNNAGSTGTPTPPTPPSDSQSPSPGGDTDSPPPTDTDSPPPTGTDSPPPTGTDSPPPTGTDSPPPTGTNQPSGNTITQAGGEVRVTSDTSYEFTPDRTGIWIIFTKDNGGSDPYLTLYDRNGNEIDSDDDNGGGYNAWIADILEAGVLYRIKASFYGSGTYTLVVKAPQEIPSNGSSIRVSGDTGYTFTPDRSGTWEFRTSGSSGDPYIQVTDSSARVLGEDDDSAGSLEAVMYVNLNSGRTYHILIWYYDEAGSGNLRVSRS